MVTFRWVLSGELDATGGRGGECTWLLALNLAGELAAWWIRAEVDRRLRWSDLTWS